MRRRKGPLPSAGTRRDARNQSIASPAVRQPAVASSRLASDAAWIASSAAATQSRTTWTVNPRSVPWRAVCSTVRFVATPVMNTVVIPRLASQRGRSLPARPDSFWLSAMYACLASSAISGISCAPAAPGRNDSCASPTARMKAVLRTRPLSPSGMVNRVKTSSAPACRAAEQNRTARATTPLRATGSLSIPPKKPSGLITLTCQCRARTAPSRRLIMMQSCRLPSRGAGNNRAVSTAMASSFLNAPGRMAG